MPSGREKLERHLAYPCTEAVQPQAVKKKGAKSSARRDFLFIGSKDMSPLAGKGDANACVVRIILPAYIQFHRGRRNTTGQSLQNKIEIVSIGMAFKFHLLLL